MGGSGELYGTTSLGGAFDKGTVFRLTPPVSGESLWSEQVLHSFRGGKDDGEDPRAKLILDSSGNIFGVTTAGGREGVGTVFELSPQADGAWLETLLHVFSTRADGISPIGIAQGQSGALYGVTIYGGTSQNCNTNCGLVYSLSPPTVSGGAWTFTRLHSFHSVPDGATPFAGVSLDDQGNIYGTTAYGGIFSATCDVGSEIPNCRTLFQLAPPMAGQSVWREKVYRSPSLIDGVVPSADLLLAPDGFVYGTAEEGGFTYGGYGTIYRIKAR